MESKIQNITKKFVKGNKNPLNTPMGGRLYKVANHYRDIIYDLADREAICQDAFEKDLDRMERGKQTIWFIPVDFDGSANLSRDIVNAFVRTDPGFYIVTDKGKSPIIEQEDTTFDVVGLKHSIQRLRADIKATDKAGVSDTALDLVTHYPELKLKTGNSVISMFRDHIIDSARDNEWKLIASYVTAVLGNDNSPYSTGFKGIKPNAIYNVQPDEDIMDIAVDKPVSLKEVLNRAEDLLVINE